MSFVILVIRVEPPSLSSSAKDRDWIWSKSPCLTAEAKPTAPFAEKYCAVSVLISPSAPKSTIIPHIPAM